MGVSPSDWVFLQMDDPSVGPKIPQALEKILQLKESRQEEMNSQQGECYCILMLQHRTEPYKLRPGPSSRLSP